MNIESFTEVTTYPTEHTLPAASIFLAISSAVVYGPVETGFSTKSATPGKYWSNLSSRSRPGASLPRQNGGLPTIIARGFSSGFIALAKSSMVLNILVSWYADTTKESHFFCRTAAARSRAGSISATTLRRGPSLLEGRLVYISINAPLCSL